MAIRVGFIGAGNMGGAIIKSLSGKDSYELHVYDTNTALLAELGAKHCVKAENSIAALVQNSEVIIAAVKPIHMKDVLEECEPHLRASTLFITVAAGLPISFYAKILGEDKKIIRTMPNTPALVGEAMTIISYGALVTREDQLIVKDIFSAVGMTEELDESKMNEVIALTGSSPAYVYMMIEAMSDAAVQFGIPRSISYRLAAQAVMGSAKMVLETGKHPGELKDMVCSPAGTTIEAVAALERKGFRDAIITAMGECTRRAREIGREAGR